MLQCAPYICYCKMALNHCVEDTDAAEGAFTLQTESKGGHKAGLAWQSWPGAGFISCPPEV